MTSPSSEAPSPTLSFVIPTLNAERYLGGCLDSIRRQSYDPGRIEIVVADGGSTDATREIAGSFGARVVNNPSRTAETGKVIGARAATNELLVFVDSDNELTTSDWLARMVAPLADPCLVASEALYWDLACPRLSFIDRYCALTGVNDPLCLFVGNYGRHSHLTGRWTDLAVDAVDHGDFIVVTLAPGTLLPTMGANGFIIRRPVLLGALHGDQLFDIDLVHDIAQGGDKKIARVRVSIAHFYAARWGDFVRKTRRRTHDFFYYSCKGDRTYPWRKSSLVGVATFCMYTLLVVPTVAQALWGFMRKPDLAWFFHPIACVITLVVYATETVRAALGRTRLYDRGAWRQ